MKKLQNLLQLIECETNNFDHTPALACCLKLTQSLSRRVIIRRISTMHVFSKAKVNQFKRIHTSIYEINQQQNESTADDEAASHNRFILLQDIQRRFKSFAEYLRRFKFGKNDLGFCRYVSNNNYHDISGECQRMHLDFD